MFIGTFYAVQELETLQNSTFNLIQVILKIFTLKMGKRFYFTVKINNSNP